MTDSDRVNVVHVMTGEQDREEEEESKRKSKEKGEIQARAQGGGISDDLVPGPANTVSWPDCDDGVTCFLQLFVIQH